MPERNQNDKYEKHLAAKFALTPGKSRIGEDASDKNLHLYELKSSTKSGGVSTARDMGPRYIEKHRKRYWIVGRFKDDLPIGLWFLAPCHMKAWFDARMDYFNATEAFARRIRDGIADSYDSDWAYRLMIRGMLLNAKCIPWGYMYSNAIAISVGESQEYYPARCAELVAKYPISDEEIKSPRWLEMVDPYACSAS